MKTITKFLFTILAVLMAGTAFSQSNEQGTIQLGLGWGLTLGGATIKSTEEGQSEQSGSGVGAKANYGLRAQYGFSDDMSGGIYFRSETAVYVVTFDNTSSVVPDITYSGTAFGLEGKYYVVNNDGFNFYPAISVGFTTGNNTFSNITYGESKTSLSGLNYSVGIGFNWYFAADVFGLGLDLNYQGTNLSGTQAATSYSKATDISVSNGGLYWGLGLTAHFGGN